MFDHPSTVDVVLQIQWAPALRGGRRVWTDLRAPLGRVTPHVTRSCRSIAGVAVRRDAGRRKESDVNVGAWGLAAVVIVFTSWAAYRYLAPETWKEWSRVGALQAFIIAFYAEMYGFPLTIYFLARYLGIDLQWTDGGNLWAQLFGTQMAHVVAMVLGYTLVFSGAALVVDGWRAVHRARRDGRLLTTGVYAHVRHPQYTGLFMILLGEGIVHWPTVVSVAAFPVLVGAYTLLARREERQMQAQFGELYDQYRNRVPMFIPRRWRRSRTRQP